VAKRGRKPDPPALRVAKENDARTVLPGPFALLRDGGAPEKPEVIAMDEVASAEWDRLVELLDGRSILSPADLALMTAYCSAWSTMIRCRQELQGQPLTVSNERTGALKAHSLLGTLSGAQSDVVKFAAELGLTPGERGRITTMSDLDGTPKQNKLSKWTHG
jgi:P27 family predicted phage terminase small subunit